MTEVKEKYDIRVRSLQGAFNSARFIAARIQAPGEETVAVAVFDRIIAKKDLESAMQEKRNQNAPVSFTIEKCLRNDLKCLSRICPAKSFGVRFSSGELEDVLEAVFSLMERFVIELSLVRDVKGDQLVCISKKGMSVVKKK